ncbi:MAG: phosphoribosylanthranilate isomerase [Candidatus Methylacidiphilales bacterium]|nr:phosphoribosylanthranilate isomerase [Candidatus Methylacidiphilales bacterium]
MTHRDDIRIAVDAGADAIGIIFHPHSPRYVAPSDAGNLLQAVPAGVARVAVGVDWTEARIREIESYGTFDYWQLHGSESPSLARTFRPRRLIKAFGLPRPGVAEEASSYDVEAFLLDKASVRHGGTGEAFDWNLAVDFIRSNKRPVLLSGGLRADNVEQALKLVQPWGVDVCSGVEVRPGRKNPDTLATFIRLCRQHFK